ncbi:MAG TPA: glycosyl hydrolase family 18 protein [Chloroflexota bacterium]|jgi:spore germination protein YaaH|nr:glycosyl hydrolase family 18 protein [Chloroflexota bacterium]
MALRRAAVRLVLGLALALGLVQSNPTRLAAARVAGEPSRLVVGYYVPYDATSWASLQAHADGLDLVAAQWVTIDGCGNLGSRDDQTLKTFAQQHHVKILPSLLTGSAWLNHQLLTDEETAAHAIEQIVSYTLAENYDGFDLDLEAIDAADRPAFSSFATWLAGALHDSGKFLTLAIPAKDRDVTVGWAGAYDYAALGAAADLITVMAYEYRGPFSGPGSVAPYDWVDRVAAFSTSQMPADKVLLGLSFYGYDWNTTAGTARSVGYPLARALADFYGAPFAFDVRQQSTTFSYEAIAGEAVPSSPTAARVAHQISVREAPPCGLQAPPSAPPRPRPEAVPGTPQSHEVWLEDGTSADARLAIASQHGARGVATWRLGLEDPRVWELFAAWRGATARRDSVRQGV